ncbi:hypothetical protein C499_15215 [Halogeometricum borinquense DSM 11551]|uniref:Glucan 1,4-alpha-glucosidase n=1 Tax=Halogeometricum borinquense (strain ATCC 700274 / DSM 11551 / JCM 10706 / KCTC 4070 / PR3) TaxID=469382 RepID=E4NTA0_HALBP|nr:glycoside hydrolase family 15 protein [Halogeometricum borinquense]ADQ68197.1 hypothetical protein Hbor_26450 [Halogeometricum borinquense DSM 11551]ELY24759.1 hypothetical protein C499_15215 [Halogeometricum borinquense DSM 11551]
MQLRDALKDYKRNRAHRTRFPGERRTTAGRFSGRDGRLVHVDESGQIRDFSYPLVGLTGIVRSRFGVRPCDEENDNEGEIDGETAWFEASAATQRYETDTTLIVTEHETPYGPVTQYDCTVGETHVTHFDASEADENLAVVACIGFAPGGRDTQIAQLRHGDAVEVYHAEETDYVASATGFEELRGEAFGTFESFVDDEPTTYPRPVTDDRYEEGHLSGDVVGVVPTTDGTATVATYLTSRSEHTREDALDVVRSAAADYDAEKLARVAADTTNTVADAPYGDAVATDLHVLSLLSGRRGLRIAGPDFDPYYAYSGGYGYTWFRDDAEISRFLFESDRYLDLALDDWHDRSARAYRETQLDDGSWPHRVWPFSGELAPGWANGRLESGSDVDYQADQTGSVVAYLARYLNDTGDDRVIETLERALAGLNDTLASDGRPITCQNAWENMSGRFTHTAATFLEGYAALAATDSDLAAEAKARADEVYEAIDDFWAPSRGIYALREYADDHEESGLDDRCDSATLALVDAHRTYAEVGEIDVERIERLVSHVETVIDELYHDPAESSVEGLIRYEGDDWRMREQDHEKIWTVSTAWGAHAAASLSALLADSDDARNEAFAETARDLLALVLPDGPLTTEGGYLPEQVFDDGTPDSATPLGWPHALRLATVALMDEYGLFEERSVVADD